MTRKLLLPNQNTREDELSYLIIGVALNISAKVGIGLMESAYETILVHELRRRGLHVERQKWISFNYDGTWVENAFRIDLLVERCVVVEIKAKPALRPEHFKQMTTYLQLSGFKLGLLINFGVPGLKGAIKRVVSDL